MGPEDMAIPADEALQRLQEGNQRFVAGAGGREAPADATRRAALVAGQWPIAAVLGCADSRVPPEVVFDQALGELFVVRVAGNVAGPTQIGSLEYAVRELGVGLVVVLGHSRCGAIQATLQAVADPALDLPPDLLALVEYLRPSVEPVAVDPGETPAARLRRAIHANVRDTLRRLASSPVLARACREGGLRIVGAEYALETGVVEFLPAPGSA